VYDDVRFLGKQEPVEEILSIADIFMMPSGSETFGLAALEAMACGVPVIASRIGGLPELVVDGETGFLCDLGDLEGYTDAADRLLRDVDLHERMAKASRLRAEQSFDIGKIVPQYEAYYEQVMEKAALAV
jgi:glycosyltransferase involved in cell wall biosynthesis